MPDIDKMTLKEVEAKIEGMGFTYEYKYELLFPKCASLIILSPNDYKFREVFLATTGLDVARAAYKWLKERKGK